MSSVGPEETKNAKNIISDACMLIKCSFKSPIDFEDFNQIRITVILIIIFNNT